MRWSAETQVPVYNQGLLQAFYWNLNRHTLLFLELLRGLFWNFSGVYLWAETRYQSLTVIHCWSCCPARAVIHLPTRYSRQVVFRRRPYCLHTDHGQCGRTSISGAQSCGRIVQSHALTYCSETHFSFIKSLRAPMFSFILASFLDFLTLALSFFSSSMFLSFIRPKNNFKYHKV